MKKLVISTLMAGCMTGMAWAQPQGMPQQMGAFGFGGQQLQNSKADSLCSKIYRDINYVGDGEEYHNLDIRIPNKPTDTGRYPVVVHIYGSAWFSNNSKHAADINTICAALLEAGYAVVTPNHRSSFDAKWPAQINDIKAVVRFIRAKADKFGFDPDFIGVSGFSSGAHLASVMGTSNGVTTAKCGDAEYDIEGKLGIYTDKESYVNCVCEWSGPVDLLHMDCDGIEKDPKSPEVAIMGMDKEGNTDNYEMLSALYFVDPQDVPIGIFHGIKDNVVPTCQGERFYERLQQNKVKSFLIQPEEGGHGFNMYSEENLRKMVQWFDEARLDPKSSVLEEGGTGTYPAIMKEEASLPAHTLFVPQDLSQFGKKNLLPVLVWGNGACCNSPFEHMKFLNEIASHGYIVIATGYYPIAGQNWWTRERSTAEQQTQAIDWIIEQNSDKNSPYYKKVDVKKIAIAGMSCGGVQTLTNCGDERIATVMVMNSGLFNQGGGMPGMEMPGKEKLKDMHTPVIYILGGETDIAYENGMDDFRRLSHVPAAMCNYPVGHGGTYGEPHGGEFSPVAINWLNWQLKNNKEAAKMFQGTDCGMMHREGWTIEKNALMK
ncbi:MAG: alpha/beta hydrolase [Bacteroidales bacterium]|nr:alpha/beta hydrolase [Bacteroidales bacterium]